MKAARCILAAGLLISGVASAEPALSILFDPDAEEKGVSVSIDQGLSKDLIRILANRATISTNQGDEVVIEFEDATVRTTRDPEAVGTPTNLHPFLLRPETEISVDGEVITAGEAARRHPDLFQPQQSEQAVPSGTTVYEVQAGDTLTSVCRAFLVTSEELRAVNPGQELTDDLDDIKVLNIP